MIYKIKGRLDSLTGNTAVVENNGIYYQVMVPSGIYEELKGRIAEKKGQEIEFYTIYYIDGGIGMGNIYPNLVGFLTPTDREFFQLFTTVKGLGTKKALKSMVLPMGEIARAIEEGDVKTLTKLPHIGGRTAEKVIAELKGKMAKFALSRDTQPLSRQGEIREDLMVEGQEVLMQLGYKKSQAVGMLEKAIRSKKKIKDTEELISIVFKESRGK